MITVAEKQSLLDITIQEEGSILTVFDFALANGLSITDELLVAQKVVSPNSGAKNSEVSNYFKAKNQMIATELNEQQKNELPANFGIGKMAIGSTFIIR